MANISTYLANALAELSVGQTAYPTGGTVPSTYLGLFTTGPTMPGGTGGVEVAKNGYARVAIGSEFASPASGGSITNSAAIVFPTANTATDGTGWGTVVAAGIFDASSGGNLLWAGTLTASKTVGTGDTFSIPSSDLTVSFT